jgi:hypothetical protein
MDPQRLVAFLRERFAECERLARPLLSHRMIAGRMTWVPLGPLPKYLSTKRDREQWLRELDVKRLLLAQYDDVGNAWACLDKCPDCGFPGALWLLRTLALPYADHPDYDPAWSPDH